MNTAIKRHAALIIITTKQIYENKMKHFSMNFLALIAAIHT